MPRTCHSALALVLALTAALCASLGCSGSRQRAVSPHGLEAYRERQATVGLLLVEAHYGRGAQGAVSLEIARAEPLAGTAPYLRGAPDLGGRVEILDSRDQVLWSMSYEPLRLPAGATEGVAPARLLLRLPLPRRAFRVRLVEPARGLEAEATIER